MPQSKMQPVGLGGWMIFPVGGLFLNIIILLLLIILSLLSIEGISIISFVINLIIILASIYGLVLVFKRKSSFPKYFIFLLWFIYILTLLEGFLGEGITLGILIGGFIAPVVWTFYIKKSKRVKNTFVN